MKNFDVIIKPVLTEKSTKLREDFNRYTFVVHKDANKIQIKNAVKEMFEVTPLNVNIINVKGKKKRVRYKYGYKSNYKKAVVTLKQGDKISAFEGA